MDLRKRRNKTKYIFEGKDDTNLEIELSKDKNTIELIMEDGGSTFSMGIYLKKEDAIELTDTLNGIIQKMNSVNE